MDLRQLARGLGGIFRALRSIQQGIISIMGQLDDLKAADAAEATAVSDALAQLKLDAEQHSADLAALAAKTADNPDLSGLVSSINGRAASIAAAVAALHASVTTPATSVAGSASVAGAADTVASGPADTVVGATSDSVVGTATASVAGADTVSAT